ncbi:POK9 protein, partial [Hylia prasina]|nr:POK9 protein [Hylia prasina]
ESGKRQSQREGMPPRDTSSDRQNISTTPLQPATTGSLGLDLAATVSMDLITPQPYKIPTSIKGPIVVNNTAMGALLLGRSSASMLGLIVLPGVIDADYTGEIYVMVHALVPPLRIEKGQRIAQLVPLPQFTKSMPPIAMDNRGEQGFGSSGELALLTLDLNTRPKKTVVITCKGVTHTLEGLLDTGADSSIVGPQYWPPDWPVLPSMVTVTGVGGLTLAKKSPQVTICLDGRTVFTTLSIVPLPERVQCLIGHDILSQIGMIL